MRSAIYKNAGAGMQNPFSEQPVSEFINFLSIQALTAALKMIDKMNARTFEQSLNPKSNQALSFKVPASLKARAGLWKQHYNTSSGAGTAKEYIDINKANNTSL